MAKKLKIALILFRKRLNYTYIFIYFFSGMPIYLPISIYDSFTDLFQAGNIGLDIARHAERKGTLVPAR